MRYKVLGRSGLKVSELCLGTMTFGEDWGFGASHDESLRQFTVFADQGGNFIDTAVNYTNGTSEQFVGEFVRGSRERYVVATKYTIATRQGDVNAAGNHRKNMVQSVESSLKRMGMDYIDLLWVHAHDGITPAEEVMRGLDDLVRAGKVLYVGISDAPAWWIAHANTFAELRGWSRFIGLQIEYSLIQRTPERELLPMARAFDIAVTPWGALGGGVLTGKYSKGTPEDSKRTQMNARRTSERNLVIARVVDTVAAQLGVSASHVALAWVRQQAGVMVPIIAGRTAAQLEDNLKCLAFTLPNEAMKALNEASAIELGFPHDFLNSPSIRKLVHGDLHELIDTHRK